MDYVGAASNTDADVCYGDNATYGVLCTLISEPVVPLCVLGKIAQLNSYYRDLVMPRINRARVLRAKYLKRFCRALWRKYTYYPLSVPEKRTQTIDLGSARANGFGIMLDHASVHGKLMFVTGISFICRDSVDFSFAIGTDASNATLFTVKSSDFAKMQHTSQSAPQPLDPSRKTEPGVYIAHVDMRACPIDVGIADSSKPWLINGAGHTFMTHFDANFAKMFFTHIVVNYELAGRPAPPPPFTASSHRELSAKVNAGTLMRQIMHAKREEKEFSVDHTEKIREYRICVFVGLL